MAGKRTNIHIPKIFLNETNKIAKEKNISLSEIFEKIIDSQLTNISLILQDHQNKSQR